eukprot:CAMPEP_0172487884 /NCGR_PEP_ID=MMETSP1066-20121228/17169_1 /TAXON_ID=671091 /ORGANISM="Coscinodiscus wailesii, Strain CCMP2513" /LENGTH=858 /DNA_ID=CAMNT_0013254773 /DNA_START=142 /DNA_END=2718 /DNA_ORIENTATION=+
MPAPSLSARRSATTTTKMNRLWLAFITVTVTYTFLSGILFSSFFSSPSHSTPFATSRRRRGSRQNNYHHSLRWQFWKVNTATILHSRPPAFTIPPSQRGEICAPPGLGPEGLIGYRLLTEVIVIDDPVGDTSSLTLSSSRQSVLCAVNVKNVSTSPVRAIAETWGQKCDGFVAAGDVDDASIGMVNMTVRRRRRDGGEVVEDWERFYRLLVYLWDNYGEEFDYFHVTGDRTFVIVENLRLLLREGIVREDAGVEFQLAMYFGIPFRANLNTENGGAPSTEGQFTISRATLAIYAQRATFCMGLPRTTILKSDCLSQTGTAAKDGAGLRRYQQSHPENLFRESRNAYRYTTPNTTFSYDAGVNWGEIDLDGVLSNATISVSQIDTEAKMRRLHKILYRKTRADCHPDATTEEPGPSSLLRSFPRCFPYTHCTWDRDAAIWVDCRPYDKLTNRPRPDRPPSQPSQTQPRDHPHAGAKDERGRWNYIHDPSAVKRRNDTFVIPVLERGEVCAPDGLGPEGPGGYRLLTEKISVGGTVAGGNLEDNVDTVPPLRVMCVVYGYTRSRSRLEAIGDTWGRRCDGFMALSPETVPALGMVHVPHFGGYEGSIKSLWQILRSLLAYVHDNYKWDYDYFHFCQEDVYLIVENLRLFLRELEMEREKTQEPKCHNPVFTGLRQRMKKGGYHTLGGFTINRDTLITLVKKASHCYSTLTNPYAERLLGECLVAQQIIAAPSVDKRKEKRYHNSDPEEVFRKSKPVDYTKERWLDQRTLTTASQGTVSFTRIFTPAKMRRLHKLLYRQNERDCYPDGSGVEPGRKITSNTPKTFPYATCTWDLKTGGWVDCSAYLKVTGKMNDTVLENQT